MLTVPLSTAESRHVPPEDEDDEDDEDENEDENENDDEDDDEDENEGENERLAPAMRAGMTDGRPGAPERPDVNEPVWPSGKVR